MPVFWYKLTHDKLRHIFAIISLYFAIIKKEGVDLQLSIAFGCPKPGSSYFSVL